ncbi:hypothetical protein [Evansella tamaricis]|uniref:Uncharacterized protein n=1 Tax=Evansella tamaricis TaxID=2069301 RepID=A0ABS6JIJ8_9BACI|nr:hypothetical protein [Evansella tamaricis]MBU9713205.1 hypothetical protein [Evansella tamaricis]
MRKKGNTWKVNQDQYIIDMVNGLDHLSDVQIAEVIAGNSLLSNRSISAVYQHIKYLRRLEWIA